MNQTTLKYDIQVQEDGHVEFQVPLPVGAHVTVFVISEHDDFDDLMSASLSSADFWDNPFDDEDWNDA